MRHQLKQQLADDIPMWSSINSINVSQFMSKTKSKFFIWNCKMDHVNCRALWKPVMIGVYENKIFIMIAQILNT